MLFFTETIKDNYVLIFKNILSKFSEFIPVWERNNIVAVYILSHRALNRCGRFATFAFLRKAIDFRGLKL